MHIYAFRLMKQFPEVKQYSFQWAKYRRDACTFQIKQLSHTDGIDKY